MRSTTFIPVLVFLLGIALFSHRAETNSGSRNRLLRSSLPKKLYYPPILFNVEEPQNLLKEIDKATPTYQEKKLLPNRVYAVFDEQYRKWVFGLTDFDGQLPSPLEAFRTLSVIPGKYLGATNPQQHYQLGHQTQWIKTFQNEVHYLWWYGDPPKIKIVTFSSSTEAASNPRKRQ